MAGILRPFKAKPRTPLAAGDLASVGYVWRVVHQVLSKLHITADGADLSEEDDGNIHIRVTAGAGAAAASFPFQLGGAANGNGITVNTGFILAGGTIMYPTVDGVTLQNDGSNPNWTPPELELGEGAWYIVLSISLLPTLSQLNVGGVPLTCLTGSSVPSAACTIQALSTPPADTPSIIDYTGQSAPTEGSYNIQIGTVQIDSAGSVTVLEQTWQTNIASAMCGDGSLFLATR